MARGDVIAGPALAPDEVSETLVYYDQTNGQVGINTATPGALLEIKTNAQYQGLNLTNGTNNFAQLLCFAADNDGGGLKLLDGGVIGAQILAAGSSYVVGAWGVGQTPSYKLDVTTNIAGYSARFANIGNDKSRNGIVIQAGANGHGVGSCIYLLAVDGNYANAVGYLEHDAANVFKLVDTSDKRIKSDIQDTKIDALDMINKFKIREFKKYGSYQQVGLVAQECQEIFPEMVSEDQYGLLGISKEQLVPVLVKAIQELTVKVEALENL